MKLKNLPVFILLNLLFSFQAYGFVAKLDSKASSFFVINMSSDTVMAEKNLGTRINPGKMTHLMTAIILFDKINKGELSYNSVFPVVSLPEEEFFDPQKRVFESHSNAYLADLFNSLVILADKQAALTLIKESGESDFILLMNDYARKLGMKDTKFLNSSGKIEQGQETTPKDLITLAKHIIEQLPELHDIYGNASLTLNGGGIPFANDNLFILKKTGFDGLISGKITENHYTALLSSLIEGRRYIIFVDGLSNEKQMVEEVDKILQWSLSRWRSFQIFRAGTSIATIPVIGGKEQQVNLLIPRDLSISLTREQYQNIYIRFTHPSSFKAPVSMNEVKGSLIIGIKNEDAVQENHIPLIIEKNIDKNSFFQKFIANSYYILRIKNKKNYQTNSPENG